MQAFDRLKEAPARRGLLLAQQLCSHAILYTRSRTAPLQLLDNLLEQSERKARHWQELTCWDTDMDKQLTFSEVAEFVETTAGAVCLHVPCLSR